MARIVDNRSKKQSHENGRCPFTHFCDRPDGVIEARGSIEECVETYLKYYSGHIEQIRKIFSKADLEDAVRHAGLATCPICGKCYPHQNHVGKDARIEFSERLLKAKEELITASNFEDIWKVASGIGDQISGIGKLTAYDAALRIGFHLGIVPKDYVYAFKGAKINEGKRGQHVFPRKVFRSEMDRLSAYQIEDFLCVFKDERKAGLFTVLK